jgi:hypothetical protein
MIIEIAGYKTKALLTGKKCSVGKLKWMLYQTMSKCDADNFVALFCRMYHFDELVFSEDIVADYVLDIDTSIVITQKFEH